MRPKISCGRTESETSSSAVVGPNRLTRLIDDDGLGRRHDRAHDAGGAGGDVPSWTSTGMPILSTPSSLATRTLIAYTRSARSSRVWMGVGVNSASDDTHDDRAAQARRASLPRVHADLHGLTDPDTREIGLGDVGAHVHDLEVGDLVEGLARLHELAGPRVDRQDRPRDRIADLAAPDAIAGLGDLRVGRQHLLPRRLLLGPRRLDLPCAPARPPAPGLAPARRACGTRARPGRAPARSRPAGRRDVVRARRRARQSGARSRATRDETPPPRAGPSAPRSGGQLSLTLDWLAARSAAIRSRSSSSCTASMAPTIAFAASRSPSVTSSVTSRPLASAPTTTSMASTFPYASGSASGAHPTARSASHTPACRTHHRTSRPSVVKSRAPARASSTRPVTRDRRASSRSVLWSRYSAADATRSS